jgi:hypothetical protein
VARALVTLSLLTVTVPLRPPHLPCDRDQNLHAILSLNNLYVGMVWCAHAFRECVNPQARSHADVR